MGVSVERSIFRGLAAVMASVVAAHGLSACVDDLERGGKARKEKTDGGGGNARIKIDGASKDLPRDLKAIKVVAPPVTWSADGSLPQPGYSLAGGVQPASALRSQAPGAYTTLPWGTAETVSLSTGTVTDLFGDGQFAIGRWTDGSDSAGQSYNVNQGRVWAVGAPVDVRLVKGMKLNCSLVASTRPTASDGNTAPGVVTGATAVVTGAIDSTGRAMNVAQVSLQYSIGSDLDQSFASFAPVGAMHVSKASRSSFATAFLGPDAAQPYLVASYGMHAPTAGFVNGLAVLSCSK